MRYLIIADSWHICKLFIQYKKVRHIDVRLIRGWQDWRGETPESAEIWVHLSLGALNDSYSRMLLDGAIGHLERGIGFKLNFFDPDEWVGISQANIYREMERYNLLCRWPRRDE